MSVDKNFHREIIEMDHSLKERTAKGLFWGGFSSLFQQVIQSVFVIFMGRILFPEDYGLFAITSVFVILANVIQESGFSVALINKKDVSEKDYSSVFWMNLGIGVFLYLLLFFLAPAIAEFYKKPALVNLSRVVFLSFVFSALGIVQNAILMKKMEMKKIAFANLLSLFISNVIGLVLALWGFSYWAVAFQLLSLSAFKTFILWAVNKWRPRFLFDFQSIKQIFPFSSKLLLASLFNQLSLNMYTLLLGKYYNDKVTGDYYQGNKWFSIPYGLVLGISGSTSLPVFAEVNQDPSRQELVFRKMLRFTSFICFPLILGSAFVSKELIIVLMTDRWLNSVPILQLLCITGAFLPITGIYNNVLTSCGHSGMILFLTLLNSILMIVVLLLTVQLGVLKMIIFTGVLYLLNLLITAYITKSKLGLKLRFLFLDVFPFLGISLLVFGIVYLIVSGVENLYWLLSLKIFLSIVLYVLIMKFSGVVVFRESWDFIRSRIKIGK